jgi:SAM-dependent methyltransferase
MGAVSRILGVSARYLREGRVGMSLKGLRALGERALLRVHPAKRRECNLCGWRGPLFLSAYYYDRFRENVFCPGCGAAERHRTLMHLLREELGGFFSAQKRRVLDIAPIAQSARLFDFAAIDYFSFDLCSPRAGIHGDLCRAPFAQHSFDFVLCYHVIEHIPDEAAAVREIFRLLKPGGLAVLQVPWDPQLETTVEYDAPREEEEGHVRRYGKDVRERWAAAGFETLFSESTKQLPRDFVRRHGLEQDVLMLVRKPSPA